MPRYCESPCAGKAATSSRPRSRVSASNSTKRSRRAIRTKVGNCISTWPAIRSSAARIPALESFDHIVIGAGTAGCIVASRLAAPDPATGRTAGRRVLLLEAGGTDRRFWVTVPVGYGRTFTNPAVNWMYQAEPDAALDGRRAYVPRGKLLGGSGAINAMVFVRGQPHDYDDWRALGNPGWGYEDVRPYFERAERRIHLTDISSFAHP